MAISLKKGQAVSLSKEAGAAVGKATMGLGWDPLTEVKKGFLGFGSKTVKTAVDLDASCMMFDGSGNMVDMVWFRQLKSGDGSVIHTGDNRSGEGEGDDEQIRVDLTAVPTSVKTLVFTVNCYSNADFTKVANAYCRLIDDMQNKEVAKFNLSCTGPHTALILAKIVREEGDWSMHAIGNTATGRTAQQLLPVVQPLL